MLQLYPTLVHYCTSSCLLPCLFVCYSGSVFGISTETEKITNIRINIRLILGSQGLLKVAEEGWSGSESLGKGSRDGGDDVRGAVCGSGAAAKKELITDNASQTSYLIWVVMINLQTQADVDIG